jgi:3-methylcrotonyl-CoA carboxylase alpha subunit
MGIRCIAVYSEADRDAPHVKLANAAFCIGPAPARESYLNVDRILQVARAEGADAIHPGYGFLSENALLAEGCKNAGIHFVGPPVKAIQDMGSKSAAKVLMGNANVPLVPGYHGDDQSLETLKSQAELIGFPVLIKASAGGGGKGMRVVWEASELDDHIAGAKREAKASFGDAHLLLEKYLLKPRHVEVQVLFDKHGHGVYLFDRDCSLQRRHQKIIEEAPAPGIDARVREAMGQAALRCGEATGYEGAGTVEFLFDAEQNFYFMEMNTRLQVEHPVTEGITGLDLVEWQLRIAQGEKLSWCQGDLSVNGHAMEVRLYAEDPDREFLPTSGTVNHLRMPERLPNVRVDSGIQTGSVIGSDYDPMLAKIIAWGANREAARQALIAALVNTELGGFTTNLPFLARALKSDAFSHAELTTDFVDVHHDELHRSPFAPDLQVLLTWLVWFNDHQQGKVLSDDPWSNANGWRLAVPDQQVCEIRIGELTQRLGYRIDGQGKAELYLNEQSYALAWTFCEGVITLRYQGQRLRVAGWFDGRTAWTVFAEGEVWQGIINQPESTESSLDEHALTAPMHGRVTAVLCTDGEQVVAGQALVIMEAMKMEHTIKAPADGTVLSVLCAQDDSISADQPLVEFDANE